MNKRFAQLPLASCCILFFASISPFYPPSVFSTQTPAYKHRYWVFLLVLFSNFLSPTASAQVVLDVSKTASLANCTPGQQVIYTILYACSSLTDPCEGTTVVDSLPAQFEFVSALGTVHTSAPVYNAAQHKITWTFLPSIPAGSTGQLRVTVQAKTGLPAGANATQNCAKSALTNSPQVRSSCANVTINVPPAANLFTLTKSKTSPSGTPFLGNNVTYRLSICNPANAITNGGVNLTNAILRDTLPTGATFVSATLGGTYSGGIVTWNLGTLSASNSATCTEPTVTVKYANPPFSAGQTVTNRTGLSGTTTGTPATIPPASTTHSLAAPMPLWTFIKTKITPSGQAFLDENVTYELSICNPANALTNGSLDALNTTFTDELPAGAVFVSANLSGVYNAGTHSVSWNLGDQLASNTSFCTRRQVTVRFPTGTFTNGQNVCNLFKAYGNIQGYPNGNQIGTAQVCHTVQTFVPVCAASIDKTITSTNNVIGETQTYRFAINNTGNVPLDVFTFEDIIPNALNLTEIKTGVYSGSAVSITVSYQTNASGGAYINWSGTPLSSSSNSTLSVAALGLGANYITKIRFQYGTIPVGFAATTLPQLSGTLINPAHGGAAVNGGDLISNCGNLSWDCSGLGNTGSDCVDFTADAFVPTPTASVAKSRQTATLDVGGLQRYSFAVSNTGNVALNNFKLTDSLPLNINFTKLETGIYSGTATSIVVKYTTTTSGGTYLTWPYGPYSSTTNSTLLVSDLGLSAGVYITNVRFEYSTVPVGWSATITPKVYGTVINPGRTGVSLALGATIANSSKVEYDYSGTPSTVSSTSNFIYNTPALPLADEVVVSKSIVNPQATYTVGDSVQFKIRVTVNKSNLINPILADLLPLGIDYKAGSWAYDNSAGGDVSPLPPTPNFEVITNYNSTGRTLLRWSWTDKTASGGSNSNYTLAEDARFHIAYKTTVTSEAAPNTNTNPAAVMSNDMRFTDADACFTPATRTADTDDLDGDGNTTEMICKCSCVNFLVTNVASLESVKWDKGELDNAWLKYPSVATTSPGGTVDYQLRVKNTGNVGMKDITFVDILPFVGDKGVVLTGFDRFSDWRPVMIAPINAPAGIKVYYSTEQNPCRNELAGFNPTPFPTGCVDNSWSLTPPTDITQIQSIKFDFGTMVMNPGDEITLDWRMIAPPDAPQNNEVAWNSFGYVATKTDDNSRLLPAEPAKVGIKIQAQVPAILGNRVWLDTDMDGVQDVGENGIDGIMVSLYKDNGDGITDPTTDTLVSTKMTASGGLYYFTNLPAANYFTVFYMPPTFGVSPQYVDNSADDSNGTLFMSGSEKLTKSEMVTLNALDANLTIDQGLFPQPLGALGGYIWSDANADGQQDEATAEGLNGVTVKLYKNTSGTADPTTDMLVSTTTTQSDFAGRAGYYLFDDLISANYYVVFVPNGSSTITTQGSTGTSDMMDSDANPTTKRTEITSIAAYEVDKTWDAGIIVPTGTLSLGNVIWRDTDNDGLYELGNGETGINGVLVNLYTDTNGNGTFDAGTDALFTSTTTTTIGGETGRYLFDQLPAGDYIVQIDNTNFAVGQPLNGLASSTGNGAAADPDNNTDGDDNGDPLSNHGIVSRAITLSLAGEPINDGDASNNTNFSLDFGVYPFVCNTLTALVRADASVCSTAPTTNFTVTTNNIETAGITLVYYTNPASNPYDGLHTGVLGTATGNGTSASFSAISLPMTFDTFYIYAILSNLPTEPSCRPSAGTSVQVIDCSCQITSANLSVFCNNNGTSHVLTDDYMDITVRPTGQFLGFSGYTYSGAFSGTANYGQNLNLQSAAGTAGAGNLSLTVTDAQQAGCSLVISITDPGICSTPPPCSPPSVTSVAADTATCTNAMMNSNAAVMVRGIVGMAKYAFRSNATDSLWATNATASTADSVRISSLPNSVSATTYTIRIWASDTTCVNDTTVILPPSVCAPCSIAATFTQGSCNNNSTTGTGTDDYFTITVSAVSATNGGTSGKYEVILNGTVLNAGGTAYGSSVTVGTPTTFKSDGATTYQLTVRDLNIPSCETSVFTTVTSAACSIVPCPPQRCIPVTITRN